MEIEKLGNKCVACYACQNVCPKEAVVLIPDNRGFAYPQIDTSKCIYCGACDKVCPVQNKKDCERKNSDADVYAVWSLNSEIRNESTSGGFFSELAIAVLEDGGYVCGAVYDGVYRIRHTVICNIDDLAKVRQSKYAQSDMGYVFGEICRLLQEGKQVLFCGTPCECAGLKGFLKKEYPNLIVCDFICRGSNSPKAYKSFVESLEKKYKSTAKRVWFKEKKYGWNRFSTYVEFENGRSYRKDRYTDYFMRGYLEHSLYLRPCCELCQFKNHAKYANITMADFWGIEKYTKNKSTNSGTSLIFLHSKKARDIFEKIKPMLYCEKHTYEEALGANPSLEKPTHRSKVADRFLMDLDTVDFCDNISRYCDYSVKFKLKHKIKEIMWMINFDPGKVKKLFGK